MNETLQRRPYLGVRMGEPGDEFSAFGLRVAGILPRSIAEAAELAAGDAIVEIGSIRISSMATLRSAVEAIRNRASTTLSFRRAGETFTCNVEVCRWPREEIENARVSYEHLEVGGARLRTIITEPNSSGPHPAVLFVQGIRRGTVDLPSSPNAPLRRLVQVLARLGVATARLERRGVGDSEGSFERLDFETEVGDVTAALTSLASRDNIDGERIALFGHSTGGMIAPLVASCGAASSVIVFGTASSSWFECIRASSRHQVDVKGQTEMASQIEAVLERDITALAGQEEPMLFGRCAAFHRQLERADIATAWAETRVPVLVLHGQFDWVVNDRQARALVAHLQRAGLEVGFHELPGLDHAMTSHASLSDSVVRYGAGGFDARLGQIIASWLDAE